jgi:hypothetical protein
MRPPFPPGHPHPGRAEWGSDRPGESGRHPADPLRLPHTDWLRHDLVVAGPTGDVAALRHFAAGPGAIPWVYPDLDREEEDRVHALLRPPDGSPGLSLTVARALARMLRAAAETQHHRVITGGGRSRASPFDLHVLVPVPDSILRLGPDDPASIRWLRQNWGTVQSLRHVRLRDAAPDRRLRRAARLRYEFWSADWTPWAAFQAIRSRWPRVVIDLRPDYGLD